jgi:DNA-binding beta-propeller fold protein YncE
MDGGNVIVDTGALTVTRVLSTNAVAAAYTCDGIYLAAISAEPKGMAVLHTTAYTPVATIPFSAAPLDVAVTDFTRSIITGTLVAYASDDLFYVSHPQTDEISVISSKGWTVTHVITDGLDAPAQVRFLPDGQRAFVVNSQEASLAAVDTLRHTVILTIPISLSGMPRPNLRGFDLTQDGRSIYGAFANDGGYGGLYRLDTSALTVTAMVTDSLLASSGQVALSADGTRAFVAQDGYLAIVRTADLSVTGSISLPSGGGLGSGDIALLPECRRLYRTYLPNLVITPNSRGPSKLGVHVIRPAGVPEFVQQVRDGGGSVAVVKALDGFGQLDAIEAVSPDTVRIGRTDRWPTVEPEGSPAEKAQYMMAQHMSVWELNRDRVDYWEILNEPDPPTIEGHVWLAEFFIECMEIAEANGYKLALFSYSVGVPEWEEWEAIAETGVFARAKQGGHILALHEYGWPTMDVRWGEPLPGKPAYPDRGVLAGRYRHWYRDFLIPRNEVIPLAITECGFDPSIFHEGWDPGWKQRYVSEMAWYDDVLRADDYVIGCTLFTLGPTPTWRDWDYGDVLDELADHIISLKDE